MKVGPREEFFSYSWSGVSYQDILSFYIRTIPVETSFKKWFYEFHIFFAKEQFLQKKKQKKQPSLKVLLRFR